MARQIPPISHHLRTSSRVPGCAITPRTPNGNSQMVTIDDLIRGTKVEPRPYQARIVGKALDLYLTKKLRSILVESPTGSGKTVMGLLIAAGLQRELGLKVGW